jgi:hypothetical protein
MHRNVLLEDLKGRDNSKMQRRRWQDIIKMNLKETGSQE